MRRKKTGTALVARAVYFLMLIATLLTGCAAPEAPSTYEIHADYSVQDPQFARAMGNLLGPPLIPGNSCATLINGRQIFPSMLEDIRTAQRTITMETFIYWSGTIGQEFTDALSDRARAGVKVHVMMDWLGSSKINRDFIRQMKAAGVEIFEYHPLYWWNPATYHQIDFRTHRKLLVVDGKIGFTGGVGIADEWRGDADNPKHWRDNHYRFEGPVVAQLQAAFQDNWMKATGHVLLGEGYFPELKPSGELVAQVFKSSAQAGSESMQLMMLLSIASARQNIRLESAYFVPDAITRKYLLQARKRGVTIEIILPGEHIDEEFVRKASRAGWGDLLKEGIKIYEYQPTMFHCKQLIVDEAWVSIGSANLDNRSFRINDEANLNVLNHDFAAGQVRVFELDKQKAQLITFDKWNSRPFSEKFSEWMASLLDGEL